MNRHTKLPKGSTMLIRPICMEQLLGQKIFLFNSPCRYIVINSSRAVMQGWCVVLSTYFFFTLVMVLYLPDHTLHSCLSSYTYMPF